MFLTALILSTTANVSVFAGAEAQMTGAWLDVAKEIWENDWTSRDGQINYLEDSISSIEEKFNSYENCKIETIENRIGLVHYEPYYAFFVEAKDTQNDSKTIRNLAAGSNQYYNTDHDVNGAYLTLKGCELFITLDEFYNQHGITQEMIDWVNPAGEGAGQRYLKDDYKSRVSINYLNNADPIIITLRFEPEDSSVTHANWTDAEFSFQFSNKYTDDYVLKYMSFDFFDYN